MAIMMELKKMSGVLALIFLFIGCSRNEVYINHNPNIEQNLLSETDDFFSYLEEDTFGLSFWIEPLNLEWDFESELWNGYLNLETPEDTLIANIENLSLAPINLILKIFLNYEEMAFHVKGEEYSNIKFIVTVEGASHARIPFVLSDLPVSAMDETFKLTGLIFVDFDYHAIDESNLFGEIGDDLFSYAINHDLSFGTGGEVTLDIEPMTALASRENSGFAPLNINPQFSVEDFFSRGYSVPPELSLQVRAGEEVELAWFTNPLPFDNSGAGLENYVIFALLDWQQIEVSGRPFIFVEVKNHGLNQLVEFGTFTIQAPEEIGYYEFIAFIVPNATHRNSFANFRPLEMTRRMTIEVVE